MTLPPHSYGLGLRLTDVEGVLVITSMLSSMPHSYGQSLRVTDVEGVIVIASKLNSMVQLSLVL